jgi:O-antigen/teichoic acid export membrane protein
VVRHAFAFSLLQRYTELGILLGSMVVLARLIPPGEFGVFVAGTAVLALASAIGDFGQRDYLVQERELTRERRSAALGLSLAASAACALTIASTVLVLPEAAVDSGLRSVLLVLMIVLLVRPFTFAATGLLQRDMRFGPVCAIGVLEAATSAVVAIFLAAQGFGAMGLAWGALAGAFVALARALSAVGPSGRTAPRLRGWRGVSRFGMMRTGVAGLTQIGDSGAMLVVSHLLGFTAAGLIDRGRRIGGLFDHVVVEAVSPVVLPTLADHERRGGDLKGAYLLKVSCVSAIAWPFFAFIALFAEPLVELLLGPDWSGVVPIVRILCLAGIWVPTNSFNARFYIALRMLPVLLRRQVILQPVKVVLVAGCAFLSVDLVAAAFTAASLLKAALDLRPLKQRLNYAVSEMLRRTASSAAVAGASLAPVFGLITMFGIPRADDLVLLLAGSAGVALGWLVGVFLVRHPLANEILRVLRAARLWLRPVDTAAAPGAR